MVGVRNDDHKKYNPITHSRRCVNNGPYIFQKNKKEKKPKFTFTQNIA